MPDSFDGMRICGVADHLGSADCLWPMKDVTVFASGMLGQVSLPDAMEVACKRWRDVSGIRLVLTTNSRTANIVSQPGRMDGPSNVLGESELPCFGNGGSIRQLGQTFDNSEHWVLSDNPPGNRIDAGRVCCHELGHAIGIPHISNGNLMAPVYSQQILGPMDGDITQVRARYGMPGPVAPPPVVPPIVPPVPPVVPPTNGIPSNLFPCLLQYGVDFFAGLSDEERKTLIQTAIGFWRLLGPEQKKLVEALQKQE